MKTDPVCCLQGSCDDKTDFMKRKWNCSFSHKGEICYIRECTRTISSHFCVAVSFSGIPVYLIWHTTYLLPYSSTGCKPSVRVPLAGIQLSSGFCSFSGSLEKILFVCLFWAITTYLYSLACGPSKVSSRLAHDPAPISTSLWCLQFCPTLREAFCFYQCVC